MVTINVSLDQGCESESFFIHKNFITHYSPYFNAAFNGSFAEGQSQQLDLEDTEPHVFGTFVNWLYSQDIENAEGEVPDDSTLVNLWLLADRLLVPKLQNHVIRALARNDKPTETPTADRSPAAYPASQNHRAHLASVQAHAAYIRMVGHESHRQGGSHCQHLHSRTQPDRGPHCQRLDNYRSQMARSAQSQETPPPAPAPAVPRVKQDPALFHRIYESTAKNSKLRAYFVDVCSKSNIDDIDDEDADDYPHDMLVDIVNRLRSANSGKPNIISDYYVSEEITKRG